MEDNNVKDNTIVLGLAIIKLFLCLPKFCKIMDQICWFKKNQKEKHATTIEGGLNLSHDSKVHLKIYKKKCLIILGNKHKN